MIKAVQDMIDFSVYIDSMKPKIMASYRLDKYKYFMSDSNKEPLVQYFVFLSAHKESAFDMELSDISTHVENEHIAERIKALTSILGGNKVFTNMFAFNATLEALCKYTITPDTVEPYDAHDLAWTAYSIMGIFGAKTFPFAGDALRYIKASLDYESWDIPPIFMAIPKVLDMYDNLDLEIFYSLVKKMSVMSIYDLYKLANNKELAQLRRNISPFLFNYLLSNIHSASIIVERIKNTKEQITRYIQA